MITDDAFSEYEGTSQSMSHNKNGTQAVPVVPQGVETDGSRLRALIERASSAATHQHLLDVFERIEADRYLLEEMQRLQHAIATDTRYWDLCCVLWAYAELFKPDVYLEIGVRRGRSASVVAAANPDVNLCLFDMWHPNYAGIANPGPDFVRVQLERSGHRGETRFFSGRSQQTVPQFFGDTRQPQSIPLVTVDGDHRSTGARADLDNVIAHLAPGGILVFDDICHPTYPNLRDVWKRFLADHSHLCAEENEIDATGTAFAMQPTFAPCHSRLED